MPIRVICAAGVMLCAAALTHIAMFAWADWLRTRPAEINVEHAIRLDPAKDYGYTLRAELREQAGKLHEAERDWTEAVRRNRNNAEAWIRAALLAEQRGATEEAEVRLLTAARVHRTWLPRWALVNFYVRQNRREDVYHWARLAMDRASEQWVALAPVLHDLGAPLELVLNDILPANRAVLSTYLEWQLQSGHLAGLEQTASKLAALIPEGSTGWPGTNEWTPRAATADDRERTVLLNAIDLLWKQARGPAAAELWNIVHDQQIVAAGKWSPREPLVNSLFYQSPQGNGLDWRPLALPGSGAEFRWKPGEVTVRLNGRQAESGELLEQKLYLPLRQKYRFTTETRTEGLREGHGLEWCVVDESGHESFRLAVPASKDWFRFVHTGSFSTEPQPQRLLLTYRRLPGFVRAQGVLYLRSVSIEAVP